MEPTERITRSELLSKGKVVERVDRNGQMSSLLLSSSCSSNLTFFLFRSFFITLPLDRSSDLVILSVGSIANWQLKTAQGEIQRNLPRKQILFACRKALGITIATISRTPGSGIVYTKWFEQVS